MKGLDRSIADQELLLAIRNGRNQIVEEIYNQHHPVFIKWVQKQGGDMEDAEDIFQEAMMVLYEKANQKEFSLSCQIGTYLFAVGKNLWYKRWQDTQRFSRIQEDSKEGHHGEVEEDRRRHEEKEAYFHRLEEALDQLGSPCNDLLRAFYYADKSMETIADESGYTNANNAKTQKYKCLMRLKKLFFATPTPSRILNKF